jgi:hypothetical protein
LVSINDTDILKSQERNAQPMMLQQVLESTMLNLPAVWPLGWSTMLHATWRNDAPFSISFHLTDTDVKRHQEDSTLAVSRL